MIQEISLMSKKIFVVLPNKDQFIENYAGSASIWVKDFFNKSAFKKNIQIFGSTNNLKDILLKKNYTNLEIPNFKFLSKSNAYINNFLDHCIKNKPSIIEVHNRPSYLIKINKKYSKSKFILIIHNDPLNLKGSKTIKERKWLLDVCYKIYFVSSWVEDKFFEGLDKNFYTNFQTICPSINPLTKFPKKEKTIIFSGKLNAAKGFDIFGSAIVRILNKYKKWNAVAVGDEPREKFSFNHKRFNFTGWIPHQSVKKKIFN